MVRGRNAGKELTKKLEAKKGVKRGTRRASAKGVGQEMEEAGLGRWKDRDDF